MRWRHVLAVAAALALLCACGGTTAGTSSPAAQTGTLTTSDPTSTPTPADTETRNVSGFNAVEISGIGKATIEQAGAESLTIEAEPTILPLLTSEVSGGTLRLGVRPNTTISTTTPIYYRLTIKELRSLAVSGTADVAATRISAGKLTNSISGAGEIKIDGTADTQELQISGSGNYKAGGLASRIATATIIGSGDADIAVSQTLTVTIRGSGKLTYRGKPAITQRITGSGDVVQR